MNNDGELQRLFKIHELIERRKQANPLEREIWIKVARQYFETCERQHCHICGKFKGITQAHHVIPLSVQYDRGFRSPNQEFVWLCPNHHVMVHLYILGDSPSLKTSALRARGKTTSDLNEDLSEDEFNRLLEVMTRSLRSPA
ncbi:MAG: hypothetical protein WA418_05795 [Bradyrhizobium sp.]